MPEPYFEKDLRVACSYCDRQNRMTLSYLLKEAQEISMQHCEVLGLDTPYLASLHKVFLLAKLRVTIGRMPRGGEEVRVRTEPYLPVRLQYPRFTRVLSREGELLAEVDSRWMLVDTETRRIVRRPPEEMPLPFPALEGLEDFKSPKLPEENFVSAGRETVTYSMVDTNGHLNNAVYADLVCNRAGEELIEDKEPAALTLFYHHEALFGESVEVSACREGETLFVRGRLPQAVCFEGSLSFRESFFAAGRAVKENKAFLR